jgi:hypothetical protein
MAYSLPISNSPTPASVIKAKLCDLHSRTLEIFCITCNLVICVKCLLRHKEHEVVDINKSSQITQNILHGFRVKFNNITEFVRKFESFAKKFKGKYKEVYERSKVEDNCENEQNSLVNNKVYQERFEELCENERKVFENYCLLLRRERRKVMERAESAQEGFIQSGGIVAETIRMRDVFFELKPIEKMELLKKLTQHLEYVNSIELMEIDCGINYRRNYMMAIALSANNTN